MDVNSNEGEYVCPICKYKISWGGKLGEEIGK